MARRVPLPRLTHRQRSSRWQRERRQQAIIVTVFTSVLVLVLGLAAWAASDRYYQANLAPAATVDGAAIPVRELNAQVGLELIRLYQQYQVPVESENDPQLDPVKAQQRDVALEDVVQHHLLDLAASEAGVDPTAAAIDDQYRIDFGEFRVRHVLISVDPAATDAEGADAYAKMRAQIVAEQLRADPKNDDLWKTVAADNSNDPGSKDTGGELGWAGTGSYVPEFEDAIRTLGVGEVSGPVRTQFGYHVLQVEEVRAPADTDLVKRLLRSGYSVDDLRARARYALLRKEFERRQLAAEPSGTAEQVHLAKIVVVIPSLTGGNFEQFTAALDKQNQVKTLLDGGTDFAEVAKTSSDDTTTAEKGGDAGWIVRGMLADPTTEDIVFATEAGKTTAPISTAAQWAIYKVLEKDPAREVTDAQRALQRQNAFAYWVALQKKAHDVQLLTGANAG